ncbi:hypothetical protein DPMN_169893 [Dreissena polymorpha]|uniref:Uncharacterized protein n=1 Tax=Dreissena polymorpha TaxID=45954 RepID=A0A9D4DWV3_DREPO|nr:hypothetical protein DPMN_169893 [Dreissena polymorpha]
MSLSQWCCLHNRNEEHLGFYAFRAGSPDLFQLTDGCSCFADAGSDVYIRSSIVVHDAADKGEAVNLIKRLDLDCDMRQHARSFRQCSHSGIRRQTTCFLRHNAASYVNLWRRVGYTE